jgi:sugar phosphate isomerase/epimerase
MEMKYAFMTFSCPTYDLDRTLALARQFGYQGIEPRIGSGHQHGIEVTVSAETRRIIRKKAEDAGIAICCLATSCKYADPAGHSQMLEQARMAIDLAADVGSTRIRVFGGQIPSGITRTQASDLMVEALTALAGYAATRGVCVCLETHDDWSDPEYVAPVMQRINHPAVGVNWDLLHPVRRAHCSIDRAFTILKPWIRHVHFHDGVASENTLEFRSMGQGDIDHRRAVLLLRSVRYEGFLSGEWINWEPADIHLPRELRVLTQYENEATDSSEVARGN